MARKFCRTSSPKQRFEIFNICEDGAGVPISIKNWSSSAATSPGRLSPTNGSSVTAPAQSCWQLKSPYKDGTTHIVMEPLEFMERLAALVPRPRLHLIRFHGVLAPNAKLRSKIVSVAAERAPEPQASTLTRRERCHA